MSITETTILDFKRDEAGFSHLTVARPAAFGYRPGQFISLTYAGESKARFYAIASHASEQNLLFLNRENAAAGDRVALSEPQGNGFTCDFDEPKRFLFLTHGTGISAIRPAMLERKTRNKTGDTLLYGIMSTKDEPDFDCLKENFGVTQLRGFSSGEPEGFVQNQISRLNLTEYGAAILIGSKEMMAECRASLAAKGFPAEKIFSNY